MNYDTFLITNSNKFPAVAVAGLRSQMQDAPDEAQMAVMTASYREPVVALLLSFFLGALGIDRFYVGDVGLGIAKLVITIITFGMLGWIWWFVDLFLIMKAARQKNYETAMTILGYASAHAATTSVPDKDDDSDFDDF
ncbi:TM2 domain-containing protein [Lacticaseibacillus hulanensis]|uniref:TM2 domain-containing protein n=1 Tax=Lacticaseibacillus hulanensis TaxID=2493111 RepID=UPI000FD9899C|nr:TM2 domain-containing protein [Lacticaseibacillus hulanensis]